MRKFFGAVDSDIFDSPKWSPGRSLGCVFGLIVLVTFAGSFFVTAGLSFLIAWIFGLNMTWRIATLIWVVWLLLRFSMGGKRE